MVDRMRQLLARAQENLRESGALLPVLLVEGAAEAALVGFQELGRTAEQRRALFFAVGRRLAHMRPRRIIAVLDAYWKASDVELPLVRSLADDPAAEECIVVVSLDKRRRSRLLVCPYERRPRLEGLEVEFKGVKEFGGGGEAYLLQAFFEGVAAAASKQGWREP
jgi:hypothetical protein